MKKCIVKIHKKEYELKLLSYNALQELFESSENESYRLRIARALYADIQDKENLSIDALEIAEDEEGLKSYINFVLETYPEIKSRYQESTEGDCYQRFYGSVTPGLNKALESMDKMFHSINQQCANKIQGLTGGISQLIKRLNSIQKMLRPIYDIQKQMVSQIGDLFKTNIKVDWDKLAGRMKVWGKYGWTIPPNIPLAVLKCSPQNKDEMDKIMQPFVQKKNMEELFFKLNEKKVNHKDLEEAIFCYRNQKYKGCAMILCALIDGNAFKIQPTKEGERRRSSKVFFRKVQKNGLDKEILKGGFFNLSLVNLTAYLEELYRQADDFKIKTNVLNRNFLLHGMNRIPVRKRDCIQLFLALYNELDIIDYLKGRVKKENWKISDLLK